MVRTRGLEPPRLAAPDPKSGVYTNFTTSAQITVMIRQILSQKSYTTHLFRPETNSFSALAASVDKWASLIYRVKDGTPIRIRT